jgi:hypothetical protein
VRAATRSSAASRSVVTRVIRRVQQPGRSMEYTGARMAQPQEGRHGKAAPRPLCYGLAKRLLEGRRIGHGAARAIDQEGAMPIPPAVVQGRALHGAAETLQHDYRKRIETVGSLIERMLPKTIHAVTAKGFELKVFLFVLAYSLNCLGGNLG